MVYIIIQLKFGNTTPVRIRIALFGASYFRILVTPDCKFDLKLSAASYSEIWDRIRLRSELGGLA